MLFRLLLLLVTTASSLALPPPEIEVDFQSLISTPYRHFPKLRPSQQQTDRVLKNAEDDDDTPLPVVLWHGLGDASNADGLKETADIIGQINPGTYVHLISANGHPDDRSASFFGNVTQQIDLVCQTIAKDPILSTAPAVDAIGFSQGGQFLRGYVERCNHPRVRSLITFGSQHNGITEFQRCKSATDLVCHAANAILKSSTVWSNYVQSHLVPAQYYRDVADYENYLEHSNFLANINNERKDKNQTYKENLSSLENFVMVVFQDDLTVIPKESGWFAEKNETSGKVTKLQDRAIYTEDWVGLKTLDQKGALHFETVKGEHMQLDKKDLKRLFKRYFGPLKRKENLIYGVDERRIEL